MTVAAWTLFTLGVALGVGFIEWTGLNSRDARRVVKPAPSHRPVPLRGVRRD